MTLSSLQNRTATKLRSSECIVNLLFGQWNFGASEFRFRHSRDLSYSSKLLILQRSHASFWFLCLTLYYFSKTFVKISFFRENEETEAQKYSHYGHTKILLHRNTLEVSKTASLTKYIYCISLDAQLDHSQTPFLEIILAFFKCGIPPLCMCWVYLSCSSQFYFW